MAWFAGCWEAKERKLRHGIQFAQQRESWIRFTHCHYITTRSESQSRFYLYISAKATPSLADCGVELNH